ncbi:MAG: Unknown protein [uncultured Sulfurovum sp.]|uniref:Uncharacterized protein n=1 Tax=uncultured Sulfurovum sp. TaxID=269237 RepID=A0A6S6SU26_9BACT|nr:MAG: Unknown protein [uncultured Sulfurovum sp.]
MKKKELKSSLTGYGERINYFIQTNAYVITVLITLTFLVINWRISSLSEKIETTLVENTRYIKKNIGHPIFLNAAGVMLVADKSEMGFKNERFLNYLGANIANNIILGLIKISNNYKTKFRKHDDVTKLHPGLLEFSKHFVYNRNVLKEYEIGLLRAMGEWRYPEHMDIVSIDTKHFSVDSLENENKNSYRTLRSTVVATTIVKSWVKEVNAWDTRRVELEINLIARASTEWASVSNPFGIKYTSIEYEIPVKPTVREIERGKR